MNAASLSSTILQFAPLIVIFGLFYWLIIRPQQVQARALKTRLSAIGRGDRVVTAGGILGTVAKVRDGVKEVEVDIAPNVRVTILRDTLTAVLADEKQVKSTA